MQGYNAQKASFSSTINVKQLGHALLSFPTPGAKDPSDRESYLITLPPLHIESLIYGTPFVELNRYTQIVSSTGYVSKIDYAGKGWLSGKKNTFSAVLYHQNDGEKKPLYTADGQWSDTFFLRDAKHKKSEIERYNAKTSKTTPLTLAALEDQDLYESRRAWKDVAVAIERGDMDATSVAKSKIENAQRELRKREKEEGRQWERKFFKPVDLNNGDEFDKLLAMLSNDTLSVATTDPDKTGGIWRFIPELAKNAAPPYHEDVSGCGVGLGLDVQDEAGSEA